VPFRSQHFDTGTMNTRNAVPFVTTSSDTTITTRPFITSGLVSTVGCRQRTATAQNKINFKQTEQTSPEPKLGDRSGSVVFLLENLHAILLIKTTYRQFRRQTHYCC
jgi:hypothetical protein